VAYRQPTVRSEIERIRGVNPDGVLKNLLEKGLIEVCGRSDGPGRPLLYGTTRDFLEFFGISDVSELPDPDPADEPEAVKNLVLKKPAERAVDTGTADDEAQ
jgi:segregation and condensation protein B